MPSNKRKSTMDGKAIRAILKKFPFIVISMRSEVKGIVYGTQLKLSRFEYASGSLGSHELTLRNQVNTYIRRNTNIGWPKHSDIQFIYGGKNHGER